MAEQKVEDINFSLVQLVARLGVKNLKLKTYKLPRQRAAINSESFCVGFPPLGGQGA